MSLNSTSPVTSASGDSENPAIVQAYWSPDADSPLYSNSITSKAPSTPSESQRQTVVRTHLDLLAGLLVAAPSEAVASIPSRCILLYTQYVFGAIPLCHEGTLRATVSRFFNLPAGGADHSEDCAQISRCFAADSEQEWVAVLRSYTVLIALCAAVTYVLPESVLPNKHLTAPLFLRVARDTLRIYVDYDVEHPDSSSLSIRLFLSSAIQISTGMYGVAFHLLNEAGLTAMKLRLYDESSLEGKDPIEENILRNAFWQLYICDKTALVMRTRPVTIHESLFETGLTLKTHSRNYVPLLGAEPESNGAAGTEDRLVQGFHVIRRLWGMAARIIRAMEASSRKTLDEHADLHECRESTLQLSEEYFEMITWTNWVQTSEESSPDECRNGGHQLSQSLQRQRTAYLVSLHYIKVAVLNTAIQCNMTEIVGLSAGPLVLAMRQIELAQDFMNVIESVPFLHLQAEGEHCVSLPTERGEDQRKV